MSNTYINFARSNVTDLLGKKNIDSLPFRFWTLSATSVDVHVDRLGIAKSKVAHINVLFPGRVGLSKADAAMTRVLPSQT